MDVSITNSPESELEQAAQEIAFYLVSPRKFLLLFLGTFGFYLLYWFYKNWRLYQQSTGEDMWPVMRAIFSIFFIHSLFAHFNFKHNIQTGKEVANLCVLATIFVVVVIFDNTVNRYLLEDMVTPFRHVLEILPVLIMGWCLYKAQLVANAACDDINGSQNNTLTLANYGWLLLGGIFWLLILGNIVLYLARL